MLDYSILNDKIIMGELPSTHSDMKFIHDEFGATAILCLLNNQELFNVGVDYSIYKKRGEELGMVMERYKKGGMENLRDALPGNVNLLRKLLQNNHKVYVHCLDAKVWTPTIVLGFLTVVKGIDINAAYDLIKQARPIALPNKLSIKFYLDQSEQ